MPVSPILEQQTTYPFVRLNEAAGRVRERGIEVIDFGMGDPRADRPADPRGARGGTTRSDGLPGRGWAARAARGDRRLGRRRFDVELDPDTEVIPTLGSKEAIFSFALAVVDAEGRRDRFVHGSRLPGLRARRSLRHARPLALPLHEKNGFLPDLDAIDDETWARLAVFWVNYPNNPTCATAPLSSTRSSPVSPGSTDSSSRPTRPTPSSGSASPCISTQVEDLTNVVVFNTLSKRSSMTGYRSGFAAGDRELIGALKAFRPTVGTAPQEFVQRASVVAWGDEEHVEQTRERYGRKRALLLDLFERKGIRVAGSEATMYLWLRSPTARPRKASRSACSSTESSSPPALSRRRGRGLLPRRARALGGRMRACGRDPGGGAVNPALAEEIVAALDSGERRVAEQGRRRLGRRRGGEGGDPRVLPAAQGRADDGRAVLVPGQDSAEDATHLASGSSRLESRATARTSRKASC